MDVRVTPEPNPPPPDRHTTKKTRLRKLGRVFVGLPLTLFSGRGNSLYARLYVNACRGEFANLDDIVTNRI
jgi:hypothetical protein